MEAIIPKGTKAEQKLFTEVNRHYEMAKESLDQRIPDFDKKDILFRSHIEESNWPYRSLVFDPRVFTALYEKTARILANKPKGRLVPREGGDSLGAMINNELLNFQWDDSERVDANPMLAKWALMDLNARKYGASFALVKWHYQHDGKTCFYDGPNMKVLANRDCLPNPSYSTIKNWFQYRDYLTLSELQNVNDAAKTKPIYKNLDLLRDALKKSDEKGGDTREANYVSKNLQLKNLTDYLGQDEYNKVVEIITEYRNDRWITFSPKHGVILRDIQNPYSHKQIPVVLLKYYPVDDDIYGLSEIEPIEKLQKAVNALVCQYLDAVNISTYPIMKVKSTGGAVQMHTLQFAPGAKWLMSDPTNDVVSHQFSPLGVQEFASTYRFLISAMQEGLGETSAGISNLDPGGDKKTATEVKDLAVSRSARDNFNTIFLAEALKKQMMFWFKMNQQFLFSQGEEHKVIRIVGKDAIKYFQNQGLDGQGLTEEMIEQLSAPEMEGVDFQLDDFVSPIHPVQVGDNVVPKMYQEDGDTTAQLIVERDDLSGEYDYTPDIESMRLADPNQEINSKKQLLELALNPVTTQLLMQEQYRLKTKEVIEDFFTAVGIKDADKYFEKLQGGLNGIDPATGQPIGPGAGGTIPGNPNLPNGGIGGMGQSPMPLAGGQAAGVIPGPIAV